MSGKKFIDNVLKDLEHGEKIFNELWVLDDNALKEKINEILDKEHDDILMSKHCSVYRVQLNSEPQHIEFEYYDRIILNAEGVTVKDEHSQIIKKIKFNKFFKLT